MAQAAATHLPPGHLVQRILETPGSSRSVLDLLNMLVIPTQAVFLLEKASTTIADAVEIWLEAVARALELGGPRAGLVMLFHRFEICLCVCIAALSRPK